MASGHAQRTLPVSPEEEAWLQAETKDSLLARLWLQSMLQTQESEEILSSEDDYNPSESQK